MNNIEVFDEPKSGVVTRGYYTNTMNQFVWSYTNDISTWYFSSTFETWFKQEEIDFRA